MLGVEPLALGWFRDSVTVLEYHLTCLDLASVFTINDRLRKVTCTLGSYHRLGRINSKRQLQSTQISMFKSSSTGSVLCIHEACVEMDENCLPWISNFIRSDKSSSQRGAFKGSGLTIEIITLRTSHTD
jgi:hypothetical protein